MKNITLILSVILMTTSCVSQKKLITSNSIGVFKLGEVAVKKIDTSFFDITRDDNNSIKSIIVTSKNYKTIDGFGVGSNLDDIKKSYTNTNIKSFSLNKGNVTIGSIGKGVIYDNISFIDNNNDNKVDFVWVQTISENK